MPYLCTLWPKGGNEDGGEGKDSIKGNCSPKDEDSGDEQSIDPLTPVEPIKSKSCDDVIHHQEQHGTGGVLVTPIQLHVPDQDDILQSAELDADVQQKLLAEIPFKMEEKEEGGEMKEEPESATTICIPYADSTTSQSDPVPYLSKRHLLDREYACRLFLPYCRLAFV